MGLTVHLGWGVLGVFVAGLVALVAMGFVLRADGRNLLHRLAAVYLFNMALTLIVLRPLYWRTADGTEYWIGSLADNIVAILSIMWVGAYLLATNGKRIPGWWTWLFLVAVAGVWAVMFASPDAGFARPGAHGIPDFAHSVVSAGEEMVEQGVNVAVMVLFLWRAVGPGARSTDAFHAVSFGAWVYFQAHFLALQWLVDPSWWLDGSAAEFPLSQAWSVYAVVLDAGVLVSLAVLLARARGHGTQSVLRPIGLLVAILWLVSASLVLGAPRATWAWALAFVLQGLLLLLPPAALAVVLLRWQFTGREARFHRGLARAATPAAMVAVFFLASEGAAAFFTDRLGSSLAGLGAATLLVFVMAPLQQLGERLGRRVAPHLDKEHVKPTARLDAFEQQLRYAWADGTLASRERARLADLQAALGISSDDAIRLERKVAAAT